MSTADVCLILEGTYPYLTGGVSTWTHNLIRSQKELTFHLVCILPMGHELKMRYELPENITGISNIFLQDLPAGSLHLSKRERVQLFEKLEKPLMRMQRNAEPEDLKEILSLLNSYDGKLGHKILLDSEESWELMVRVYFSTMEMCSFLNYFWSFRNLLGGLYSILLSELPQAKLYHALCTGFAGLYLSRAHVETGMPCLITEHGIYTNERRIEISSAQWLEDFKSQNLTIDFSHLERAVKDFWIDTFSSYSLLSYKVSSKIITLFEGNTLFQISDGADPDKLLIIPNGVNIEKYSQVKRDLNHPPTVALIGRVVHIKDIKTFIRAIGILKKRIPDLKAYLIGPQDEDPEYFEECQELIEENALEETLELTGKVNILDYLGVIDVIVLTSLSEGQPLTLLEAGAAGIPSVSTDVGACQEILLGTNQETEEEQTGGVITPLANPQAVAKGIEKLLTNQEFYQQCSRVIAKRVEKYYNEKAQDELYNQLYLSLIDSNKPQTIGV